jgi:hypothetical protein
VLINHDLLLLLLLKKMLTGYKFFGFQWNAGSRP